MLQMKEAYAIPVITADADMFVIPNGIITTNDVVPDFNRNDLLDFVYDLYTENKCNEYFLEFMDDEPLVQVWYCSNDLNCSNMVDHEFKLDVDGKKYFSRIKWSRIPYSFIKDLKEGETVNIKFPVIATNIDDDEDKREVVLDLNITAAQKEYRYRRFGKFEDIVDALMHNGGYIK